MSHPRSGTTQRRPQRKGDAPWGFTLLEMVVVITIIAILAASLVPVLMTPFVTEKRLETVNEMRELERAITGRPEYGDFGFLGTMGRLPIGPTDPEAGFATELILQGSMPAVTVTPSGAPVGVPVGWNGPYVRSEYLDPTRDAWGNQYRLILNPSDHSQWRLVSSGQDRVAQITGTNPNNGGEPCDDVVFPSQATGGVTNALWFSSKGTVFVDVWGDYGSWQKAMYQTATSEIVSVAIWYPDGSGALTSVTCTPVVDPATSVETNTFQCLDVPFGLHTVSVTLNNNALTHPQFQNYASVAFRFDQNVANSRQNTYQRLMVPLAPSAFSTAATVTSTLAAGTASTTGVPVLSGNSTESGYFPELRVGNGPGTRMSLAEARAWGVVRMPDATTDCKLSLEPNYGDGIAPWTADSLATATILIPPTGVAGGIAMPFSLTARYSALPTYISMFRLTVAKGTNGTGTCQVVAGAQATVFRQLATP